METQKPKYQNLPSWGNADNLTEVELKNLPQPDKVVHQPGLKKLPQHLRPCYTPIN